MQQLMEVLKFVWDHSYELVAGLTLVLGGLIAIFTVIPGDQPETMLKKVVEFIEKFSRKPKAE
jgi:hypothetical protein